MPLLSDFPSSRHAAALIAYSGAHKPIAFTLSVAIQSDFVFHERVTSCHYKHIHAFVIPYKLPESLKSCFEVSTLLSCQSK